MYELQNNLRCMTLAAAITRAFDFSGSLENFCRNDSRIRVLHVIEVNPSGTLLAISSFLLNTSSTLFHSWTFSKMSFEDSSIDVMIHSDTLEHVPNSRSALKECRRVLKPEGRLFYTVPIVVGRLTRTRRGLPASYHGKPDLPRARITWCKPSMGPTFGAKFSRPGSNEVTLTSLTFPASVAIAVSKARVSQLARLPLARTLCKSMARCAQD